MERENIMVKKSMLVHLKERFGEKNEWTVKPELPRSLNIELNNTCNHQCVFCEFHSPYSSYAKDMKLCVMDTDLACKILEQAWELGIGKKEVGFYAAGEAFLHKDFAKIVHYAKSLGFSYTFITTNGALATPSKLVEVVNSGLDSIRFSVNAGTRETYKKIHGKDDFDTVINNIKFLREYLDQNNIDMNTSISYVVTKENKKEMLILKELINDCVDEILFIPVLGVKDWNEELSKKLSLDEYEEKDRLENKRLSCPLLFNAMYITSAGKVKLCCDTYKTDIEVYDLNKDLNLKAAWNAPMFLKYRAAILENNVKGTACENCHQLRQGVSRVMMDMQQGM
mgnify:CR=1